MAPCKGALNRVKSPYGEHSIVLHIPRDGALYEDSAPGLTLNAAYGDVAIGLRDKPERLGNYVQ